MLLLIFEGALRKWILPGYSNPILIIRDPIVVLIYVVALQRGVFPMNAFVGATLFLAIVSYLFGTFSEFNVPVVLIYGIRTDFLHVPIIFVMGRVLSLEDIVRMGKIIMLIAIPMTVLMAVQFVSPQSSWANTGVGGTGTATITGALGRYRPPGTFSFITGVAAFYPLALAFLLGSVIQKSGIPRHLQFACALSIVLAIPISISRLTALSCAIVLMGGLVALILKPGASRGTARLLGLGAVLVAVVPFLPFWDEGVETFSARREAATGEGAEGFKQNVVVRYLDSFLKPLLSVWDAPFFGHGIGTGTNVGAKFLTGNLAFLMGEGEWQRNILEMGPLIGLAFIGYRCAIGWHLLMVGLISSRRGNAYPILLLSSCVLLIINGQWGPPTILGFAVFGGGLALASADLTRQSGLRRTTSHRRRYARVPPATSSTPGPAEVC